MAHYRPQYMQYQLPKSDNGMKTARDASVDEIGRGC